MSVFDIFNPLSKITPRFTEEQLGETLKWFDENAKPLLIMDVGEPVSVVTIEQLIEFLEHKKFHKRSYHYPTYNEIMMEVEKLKVAVSRVLTREQFIYILNLWVLEPDVKHELKLAFQGAWSPLHLVIKFIFHVLAIHEGNHLNHPPFRAKQVFTLTAQVFDTERRNFLEIDEIRSIVKDNADVFSEAETLEIMRDANISGTGNVSYEDFVESIFRTAPELHELKANYLYDDPNEDPSVSTDPGP